LSEPRGWGTLQRLDVDEGGGWLLGVGEENARAARRRGRWRSSRVVAARRGGSSVTRNAGGSSRVVGTLQPLDVDEGGGSSARRRRGNAGPLVEGGGARRGQ